MRVTEHVLWSAALNLNPVYQRLQWAADCVCVAASLLPPFASSQLCVQMPGPLWLPIQHSQCSSSLGPALQYPWFSKQEPTFNCTSAAGSGIDEKSPCIIKEITARAPDVFINS